MNSQNINDVKKKGVDFIAGVAIKPGTQIFPLTSRDIFYSENIVLAHTDRFVLSQYGAMRIWLTCIGANYTGSDVLTVRFYRAEGDVGATRMAIVKDVAVTLPNVNNGYSGYVNIPDTTGILADCTHFSISGTITRPAGATIKAVVTAYASDSTEVEIINSGAIATEDENSDDILTAVEKLAEDNFEDSLTGVETWLELPENIKSVSFILDCSSNTQATLEYTFDRAASPSVIIESELGTLVNDKEGGYLAGAVAQVRMNDVVSNAVPEVKSSLPTDLVGDNNDLVYTSKLTGVAGDAITIAYIDPAQAGALSIVVTGTDIVVNLAHDGNAITTTADDISDAIALDPAADALVGVANKAGNDGNGVVTVMAKTALTGGVNAVAATLPKLWIIGVK